MEKSGPFQPYLSCSLFGGGGGLTLSLEQLNYLLARFLLRHSLWPIFLVFVCCYYHFLFSYLLCVIFCKNDNQLLLLFFYKLSSKNKSDYILKFVLASENCC